MAVHSALGQQREGKTIHSQLRHSTASWIFSNNSAQKCEQRSITSSLRRELRFPFTFQSKASQLWQPDTLVQLPYFLSTIDLFASICMFLSPIY
jgi:hypothetical protein